MLVNYMAAYKIVWPQRTDYGVSDKLTIGEPKRLIFRCILQFGRYLKVRLIYGTM